MAIKAKRRGRFTATFTAHENTPISISFQMYCQIKSFCVCVRRREEGGEYSTSNCWHFHYNQYFSLSGVHRYPPTVVETKWKIVLKKPLQHILEIRNLSETQHRGHSGTLWRCSDGLEATLDWFIHFTSQLMYGIHKHSVYCINKHSASFQLFQRTHTHTQS